MRTPPFIDLTVTVWRFVSLQTFSVHNFNTHFLTRDIWGSHKPAEDFHFPTWWRNDSQWNGRSGDRIPVGSEIFCTRPDPSSHLYNGYRVSFPGVKRPGCGINYPPPSSAEIKERVELYLCSSSGGLWSVLRWTLPFNLNKSLLNILIL